MKNIWRRICRIMLTFCIIFIGCIVTKDISFAAEDGDYEYEYRVEANGTATLTKIRQTRFSFDLVIPSTIDGYTVEALDSNLLEGSFIMNITIPGSVKTIADKCFFQCTGVTNVVFSEAGLQSIGDRAFYECNLQNFTFPETLQEVRDCAFSETALTDIIIPKTNIKWGKDVFSNSELTSVTIEEGATTVAAYLFCNCDKLETITLPSSLKVIEAGAFQNDKSIKELVLPKGLEKMGGSAFYSAYIKKLIAECQNVVLGNDAMYSCRIDELHCLASSPFYKLYKDNAYTKVVIQGCYLSTDSVKVKVNKSVQLNILNTIGETTWKSSNTKIAKVSDKGMVTGVKKGKTTIAATNNGITVTCEVIVNDLSLNKSNITVTVGYKEKLKLEGGKNVKWKSSNKKVVTVSSKGQIKGIKKGKAVVTAKSNGKQYKCKVTVDENYTGLGSFSSDVSRYPKNEAFLGFFRAEAQNNTYVIYGKVINNTSASIKNITSITITLKSDGKVIAKQNFKNVPVYARSGYSTDVQFKFSPKNVKKKKADLRKNGASCSWTGGDINYIVVR